MVNAVENLYFFEGYKEKNGELIDEGKMMFEGEMAYKLVFAYPSGQRALF